MIIILCSTIRFSFSYQRFIEFFFFTGDMYYYFPNATTFVQCKAPVILFSYLKAEDWSQESEKTVNRKPAIEVYICHFFCKVQ